MYQFTMWWLRSVGSLKSQVSFAKEPWKRDDILQKRPVIFRSLLNVATPYIYTCLHLCTYTPRAISGLQSCLRWLYTQTYIYALHSCLRLRVWRDTIQERDTIQQRDTMQQISSTSTSSKFLIIKEGHLP